MKLVKCYVASFGKLKNYTYDFTEGLNTIKEDNGWGKSTLATFIKAMFYGLNDNKRSVSENERLKFKPWGSNDKFGGYVQFFWGEKQFKIERFFGSKESEDTVQLIDVETGKTYRNTENLGKRIFEIDEEGFLSTTYYSQKDFQIKSNSSLTAKFNSVCEIQDTEAFDRAILKLENKAKTFKYRGDKGLISEAKNTIYFLNDEIERSNRAVKTVAMLKEDEDRLKGEVVKLQQETKLLTDKVENAGKVEALRVKKEHFEHLTAEKNKLLEDKLSAENLLKNNFPDENQIRLIEEKTHKITALTLQKENVQSDILVLEKSKPVEKKNKRISIADIIAYSFSGLIAVLGIVLFILQGLNSIFAWVATGIAISVLLVLGILKLVKKPFVDTQSPYLEMLNAKSAELSKINVQIEALTNEVDEFIALFNLGGNYDRLTSIKYVEKITRVYNDICEKLRQIEIELKNFDQVKEDFNNVGNVENLSMIKMELSRVQDEYSRKTTELANKRSAINLHEELASSFPELEAKKAEINEKINKYEEEYTLISNTVKFLKQADENLKIKYRAPLQNSLRKYYEYIAENGIVNIDVDLKITIEEESGNKVTDFYSKGYQNLFEICKRFALTDVLFTGEKPFIILDDPFYNLDDKKLAQALELIKKLSKDYQIIYLVCHESRRV